MCHNFSLYCFANDDAAMSGEKICITCHSSILFGEKKKTVTLDNVNKQVKTVFNQFCFSSVQ
jgi:hypothetical protein